MTSKDRTKGPAKAPRIRTRVVQPHSSQSESFWVAVLAMLIVYAMVMRLGMLQQRDQPIEPKTYQRLDSELSTEAHLVYRTMLASVADIDDLRAQEGQWPEALLLDQEGIPPFARALMPTPADRLQWVSYDGGTWVDYLGTDVEGENKLSYILRLIDLHGGYHPHPHPGVDYDPELAVAAQVWVYDQAGRYYPGERLPEAGWSWVLSPSDPVLSRTPIARLQPATGTASQGGAW